MIRHQISKKLVGKRLLFFVAVYYPYTEDKNNWVKSIICMAIDMFGIL